MTLTQQRGKTSAAEAEPSEVRDETSRSSRDRVVARGETEHAPRVAVGGDGGGDGGWEAGCAQADGSEAPTDVEEERTPTIPTQTGATSDWPAAEGVVIANTEGKAKCVCSDFAIPSGNMQNDTDAVVTSRPTGQEACLAQPTRKSTGVKVIVEHLPKDDKLEEVEPQDDWPEKEQEANAPSKPREPSSQCKECGECFNYREILNLQCHHLAHGDELTPLSSKECSLTFKHRGLLIRHRNNHKDMDGVLTLKQGAVEGSFECAECEHLFSTVKKLREHSCNDATTLKPYHCPLCRQEFQHKVAVTAHIKCHSMGNFFPCQECHHIFPDCITLRDHQLNHRALKPYECSECGMVFKHYYVMEDHRRKHADTTRCHVCHICGRTFKFSSLLHQHQYLHTGQKPFFCPECGKRFAFAQNMKAHCRQHRQPESDNPPSMDQSSKPVTSSLPEAVRLDGKENTNLKQTFICPLCQKTLNTPANLRVHLLTHEVEHVIINATINDQQEDLTTEWRKGHPCPHCPSIYRDAAGYRHHLIRAHSHYIRKSMIPDLNLSVLSGNNVHGKRKTSNCSACSKGFHHLSVLDVHMHMQTKEKPYQCNICKKGFKFGSYLRQHMIVHTGSKPFKCPDCGKEFGFLQNMRTHLKLHQEKPFRCSCKGYSDEIQLQHHMLSHSGNKPHKCTLCNKSFGLSYLLRDHMNTHTEEQPHGCNKCQKTFSWFSSLLKHRKIHTRKHRSFSQSNSLLSYSRGKGCRSNWSVVDSGLSSSEPHCPYSSSSQGNNDTQQKESALPKCRHPVQWRVDGGELLPVPSSQSPQSISQQLDDVCQSHSDFVSIDSLESTYSKEGFASEVGSEANLRQERQLPNLQVGVAKVPISTENDPQHLTQAITTPVWTIQNVPMDTQTMITGQLKAESGQEPQTQQPMITTTQIIVNQPSPCLSAPFASISLPVHRPPHSVTSGTATRPLLSNILFTQQTVVSEQPSSTQTLPPPQFNTQAAPYTHGEPDKPTPHLPFSSECRLQCMICRCLLSRELDLQMHYLQHALGEI